MMYTESARFIAVAAIGGLSVIACSASSAAQDAWEPEKPVEIVVGAAPGGGNDKTAREVQKIWSEKKLVDSVVVNKVGGSGAIAYSYVSQKNDPHFVAVSQANLVTNHISGNSNLQVSDVTPLGLLGTEPVAIAVKADSPYKNIKEFLEQLKKDPSSLSISVGSSRGSTNHIAVAMTAKTYGIDPKKLKIVVFGGGAESVTNLLGGHIDALSAAVNNPIPHHKAGTMRILCVTSEERAPTVPDAPTCKEQGVDVVTENWAILIGPKSLTPVQRATWEKVVQKTAQDADWQEYLNRNAWSKAYKNAEQSKEYLEKQYTLTKDILREIGMSK